MAVSNKYLLPEADGLPMRESNEYAKDKLRIVETYISMFITAMRNKNWKGFFYIDLQAGPGKNIFGPNDIGLGSPLLALTATHNFTHYRFVELDPENAAALRMRIAASERHELANVIEGDCNVMVNEIVREIKTIDEQKIEGKWASTLNLAFLDPEGLELEWQTVEKLGQVSKMDLIINFSTSGFTRTARKLFEKEDTRIDRFFGTPDWRNVYRDVAGKDNAFIRRAMIDFYRERLAELGYQSIESDAGKDEQVFRNTKNMQQYTLIAASKHELGVKFWHETIGGAPRQPRLF